MYSRKPKRLSLLSFLVVINTSLTNSVVSAKGGNLLKEVREGGENEQATLVTGSWTSGDSVGPTHYQYSTSSAATAKFSKSLVTGGFDDAGDENDNGRRRTNPSISLASRKNGRPLLQLRQVQRRQEQAIDGPNATNSALEGIPSTSMTGPEVRAPILPRNISTPWASSPTSSPTVDSFTVYRESKETVVTMDSDNGSFGTIFSVTSLATIRITSIDFHTDLLGGGELWVEVYTRRGDYRGFEHSPNGWGRVAATAVVGAGKNEPTRIPYADFATVKIPAGETQSFYLTLNSEDMRYSNAGARENVGSVYVRTPDLEVFVGKGVHGYPAFGTGVTLFNKRVFNGVIHYDVAEDIDAEVRGVSDESSAIRLRDRIVPGVDLVTQYERENSLVTSLEGRTRGAGVTFEIAPLKKLSVTGFDLHLETTETVRVEIWVRPGNFSGFESDRTAWTRLANTFVEGQGVGRRSPLPVGAMEPIRMGPLDKVSSVSFYVTIATREMRYDKVAEERFGSEFSTNQDLRVFVGVGVGYPFEEVYKARVFNGSVRYRTMEAPPPPFVPAEGRPSIITQQRISIAFPSADARRRCLQQLLEGRRLLGSLSASDLPDSAVGSFESLTAKQISDWGLDAGIGNVVAVVSTDIEVEETTSGSSRRRLNGQEEEAVLDMFTTIKADVGEGARAGEVDFNRLAGDALNDNSGDYLKGIQEIPEFEESKGVFARLTSFEVPPKLEAAIAIQEVTGFVMEIVYIVGAGLAAIAAFTVACCRRKCSKKVAIGDEEIGNEEGVDGEKDVDKLKSEEEPWISEKDDEIIEGTPTTIDRRAVMHQFISMHSFRETKSQIFSQ